jgi:hypothetical protein
MLIIGGRPTYKDLGVVGLVRQHWQVAAIDFFACSGVGSPMWKCDSPI